MVRRVVLMSVLVAPSLFALGCAEVEPEAEEALEEASFALSPTPVYSAHLVASQSTLGPNTFAVATGDVDGDGQIDVLGLNDRVRAFSFTGSGFEPITDSAVPAGLDGPHLAAADFNHDSKLDVIYSGDYWAPDIVAFTQDGSGALAHTWTSDNVTPKHANGLAAADVDGDGWMDAIETAASGKLVVWWNNPSAWGQPGAQVFQRSTHTAGGEWVSGVIDQELAVGRFNRVAGAWDARADVALRSGQVYFSNGRNAAPTLWGTLPAAGSGEDVEDVEAADFDGDGDLDLAFLVNRNAPASDEIRIFNNLNGQGFSMSATAVPLGINGARRMLVGHFDRDGGRDFFVTYLGTDGKWAYKLARRQGAGYAVEGLSLAVPVLLTKEPSRLAAADINNDGLSDIVVGYNQPPNQTDEALVVYMSQPAPCAAGSVEVVSKSSQGVPTQGNVYEPRISGNGRYVVFTSDGADLVPGDTNGAFDVFVHDRATGETTRESVFSEADQANGMSMYGDLSADGRYVAFVSDATNLVPGDTNGAPDVFLRDRWARTTTRVSVSSAGAQSNNAYVEEPAISANGRYVAFYSTAIDLAPGPCGLLYVRDLVTGTTSCGLKSYSGGAPTGGLDIMPSLSADGRYMSFSGYSSNLVPGDTNNTSDAFVRDLLASANARASVSTAGAQANDYSYGAVISPDGKLIAFATGASNLVSGDTNGFHDVFVRNRELNTTQRVSLSSAGAQANGHSESWYLSMSYSGRYVAFSSAATNLTGGGSTGIFVRNRSAATTTFVAAGAEPSLSHSGQSIAYVTDQARVKTLFCDGDGSNQLRDDPVGCQLKSCNETSW